MNSSAFPFFFFPSPVLATARAEMTLPRVVRDLLIFAPSLSRWPEAPVELARSEPAKSTRLIEFSNHRYSLVTLTHLMRDTFSVSRFVASSCRFIVKSRVKTA